MLVAQKRGGGEGISNPYPPFDVEWKQQKRRRIDDGTRRKEREKDSEQVFSCAMHNEERQTALKGPTNKVRSVRIHSEQIYE